MSGKAPAAGVETRLAKVEEELARLKKAPRDWLEVVKAVGPLVSAVAVVVVGYFLTGSVNNAVQRQQLELSHVREMRELLLDLGKPGVPREQVQATALTLSAFGSRAVAPLINLLQGGGETRVVAAQEALRAIGLTDHDAVCAQLAGELGCIEARPVLEDYARLLASSRESADLAPYSRAVRPDPAPSRHNLEQVQAALDQSLALLKQAAP